jgi:hypothetical protein
MPLRPRSRTAAWGRLAKAKGAKAGTVTLARVFNRPSKKQLDRKLAKIAAVQRRGE